MENLLTLLAIGGTFCLFFVNWFTDMTQTTLYIEFTFIFHELYDSGEIYILWNDIVYYGTDDFWIFAIFEDIFVDKFIFEIYSHHYERRLKFTLWLWSIISLACFQGSFN